MHFVDDAKIKVVFPELLQVAYHFAAATGARSETIQAWNGWFECWSKAFPFRNSTTRDGCVARWHWISSPSRIHWDDFVSCDCDSWNLCAVVDIHTMSELDPLSVTNKVKWHLLKASFVPVTTIVGTQTVLIATTMIRCDSPSHFRSAASHPPCFQSQRRIERGK